MTEASREWLEAAQNNINVAEHSLSLWPVPREVIFFLSQQCAEMALKGVLIEHDIEPPVTHNLERLCQMCAEQDSRFYEWIERCGRIAPYASRSRYPNGPEVTVEIMNLALKRSREVFEFIQSVLEGEEPEQEAIPEQGSRQ